MKTFRKGKHGKSLRIYCHNCKRKITINDKEEKSEQLLKDHLNRNSYRILESENSISKKTICSLTTSVTKELINSNELTKLLKPQKYCGIILIDGKYAPVKEVEGKIAGLIPRSAKRRGKTRKGLVILPFIDYLTHDIPVYVVGLSENSFELEEGFKFLKEIGYKLHVVVCDESMGKIAEVAKKYYPKVVIQTCLKHYSAVIDRTFQTNSVKRRIKSLENKLKKMDGSFLLPTRHYDRFKAIEIVNEIADLEYHYGYLIRVEEIFQEIFFKAENMKDLNRLEDELNIAIACMDLKNYPYQKKIKDRYLDYYEKREIVAASLLNSRLKIPRTTNLIEGFNSTTLELRFTSIRGFKKEQNARDYINAMILKYRFHKFTDCKGKFKSLNKRSPLEIAEPKNYQNFSSQDWVRFCRKVKKKAPK